MNMTVTLTNPVVTDEDLLFSIPLSVEMVIDARPDSDFSELVEVNVTSHSMALSHEIELFLADLYKTDPKFRRRINYRADEALLKGIRDAEDEKAEAVLYDRQCNRCGCMDRRA